MLQLFVRIGLQAVPPLRHSPLSKLKKNRRFDKKEEEKNDVNAPHGALGELFFYVSLPEFRVGR